MSPYFSRVGGIRKKNTSVMRCCSLKTNVNWMFCLDLSIKCPKYLWSGLALSVLAEKNVLFVLQLLHVALCSLIDKVKVFIHSAAVQVIH